MARTVEQSCAGPPSEGRITRSEPGGSCSAIDRLPPQTWPVRPSESRDAYSLDRPDTQKEPVTVISFEDLALVEPIRRALNEEGYTQPTPIQAQAIPHLLLGRDLLGIAQTGTGKTAAFALPILQRLAARQAASAAGARRARVLVLTPTRELAAQIGESFRAYGRHLGLRSTVIFGGVGQDPQVNARWRAASTSSSPPRAACSI